MANYKIIRLRDELEKFINFLPVLEEHEVYYMSLFVRKKYCPDPSYPSSRKIWDGFCKKEDILRTIERLEIKEGLYHHTRTKESSIPVADYMALYIDINPKNLHAAYVDSSLKGIGYVYNGIKNINLKSLLTKEVAVCNSRRIFTDFDYDDVEPEVVLENARKYLNDECLTVIQTRGGAHLLVEHLKVTSKLTDWYKGITSLEGYDGSRRNPHSETDPLEEVRQNMLPIPGTNQGGFPPLLWWYNVK